MTASRLSAALVAVSVCAAAAVVSAASPAHADESPAHADEPLVERGSLGLVFRTAFTHPSFGGASFGGWGNDAAGVHVERVASGVQLGLLRPPLRVYEGAFDLDLEWFHGAIVVGFGKTAADAAPQIESVRSHYQIDDVTYYRFGLELGASYWIGGHLRLMGGATLGVQGASMLMPDLIHPEYKTAKGSVHPAETATASMMRMWLSPRIAAEVLLGETLGVGVGTYLATDAFHPLSWETGITISARGVFGDWGKLRLY